jgi:hypothetical protein
MPPFHACRIQIHSRRAGKWRQATPRLSLIKLIMALLNFEWVDLWTIDDLLVVDAPVAERSLVGR